MAFRSAIEGLDKVIRSDILPPKVILVTGPPGSMKTSFCYTLMSRYLKDTGEFGLYTTLEETVQSHLRNMESLGVELSMNMQISDFTDLREIDAVVGPEDQTDYLAFIEFGSAPGDDRDCPSSPPGRRREFRSGHRGRDFGRPRTPLPAIPSGGTASRRGRGARGRNSPRRL